MKSLLITMAFIFSPLVAFLQTTYYVSTSGSDDNSGTSPSSAFASLQAAIDNAQHGDTIKILAGTYASETIYITDKRTSSDDYLVIKPYGDGKVYIDGSNLASDPQLFYIENANNIVIQGLVLQNNQRNNAAGFDIEGNCQNIHILDNEITGINFSSDPDASATSDDNAYPLIVYATDGTNANTGIIISGNIIHDCRTGWSEALALNGNVDGFEVSNNVVYNISNIGIDAIGFEGTAPENDYARNGVIKNNIVHNCVSPYAECGGIYIDGGRNIVVQNNISYQNQYGIEIGNEHTGTTTLGIIVRDNVFYRNQNIGILVGGYRGQVENCTITGNTTFGNNTGGTWGAELYFSPNCAYITVKNNIFFADNSQNIIVLAEDSDTEPNGLILNYNLYYNSNGSSSTNFNWFGDSYDGTFDEYRKTGHDANSIFSDPLLKDPFNYDFHLTTNSPAINAGDPDFSPAQGETDIDGDQRVIDGRVDIGADEFNATQSGLNSLSKIYVYPVPAHDFITVRNMRGTYVQIFDLNGKLIRSVKIKSDPCKININNLPPGIYQITSQKMTIRFVKF